MKTIFFMITTLVLLLVVEYINENGNPLISSVIFILYFLFISKHIYSDIPNSTGSVLYHKEIPKHTIKVYPKTSNEELLKLLDEFSKNNTEK